MAGLFRKPRIWAPLYFILMTGFLLAFFSEWTYDDPYITYRYAENLAAGRGFVYNPGENVLSTTTPLFTMILSVLSGLPIPMPLIANALGAAALAAGGLLLARLIHRIGVPAGQTAPSVVVVLLLYPTFPLLVSTLGSETPLALALAFGTMAAFLDRRFLLAGLLYGLAVLARGDTALIAPLLALEWLRRRRTDPAPFPWATIAVATLLLLPWYAFAVQTFGSPLPATLGVKQAQANVPIATGFLPGVVNFLISLVRSPQYLLQLALFTWAIALVMKGGTGWGFFFGWMLLYIIAYTALGVTSFFWYYASLVPGLVVGAGLGLSAAQSALRGSKLLRTRPPGAAGGWLNVFAGIVLLVVAGGQYADLYGMSGRIDDRREIYRAIGEWFAENTPEDTSIGTLEVGIIGYYAAPRPMIDFGGLVRPEIAGNFGDNFSFPQAALWAAERYQPDYLVVVDGRLRELIQNYAVVRCIAVATFIGAEYGHSKDILLYLC